MRSFFFALIGSLLFTGTAFAQNTVFSSEPFTDVPANSMDYQAIEYLRTKNVVRGYIDGTFKPDTRINRAEFVEFIINPLILDTNDMGDCVRTNISDAATNVFFSDVSKDAWYAENICFAKTKQIIDGYPDGTFRPGAPINFVEAAKIISNVFTLNLANYQAGEFWYRAYVQSLSDLRAIPTSIRNFGQMITRGEMAQIVYRLKVDSTGKSSMGFNAAGNTLYARNATGTPPAVVPPPPVDPTRVDRPSRRSIVEDAEQRNALRSE
ncbi:MAG: S-layer homology domain-containing protein [Candidatus Peribacteraceae bacterium]|nr:S-layer homology domain-containing protein [Candidatus Peribacteraceae bacterium]